MYNQRLDICRKDEKKYKGMENKKKQSPKERSIIQATERTVLLKILIGVLEVIQGNISYIKILSQTRY